MPGAVYWRAESPGGQDRAGVAGRVFVVAGKLSGIQTLRFEERDARL
jgi:hypothetical protein